MLRRILILLALVVVCTPTRAQNAPDMFKDVPQDHWAYQAVDSLRARGILVGYPDGYFRGKRTLTRYEFAVALDRALKLIEGTRSPAAGPGPGPQGPQGPPGVQGPSGPKGMTPEEVVTLRRLLAEFRNELATLGNNMASVNRRVDQLAREIAELRLNVDRMPRLSGGIFAGFRADISNGDYVDRDGRVNPLGKDEVVVHQFRLGLDARLGQDSDLTAAIMAGNYKSFLGGSLAQVSPRPQGLNLGPVTGHFSNSLDSASRGDVYLDRIEIRTPFRGIGRGSTFTIGRFNQRLSRLTLWRPDVDSYFSIPWEDDGYFRLDGARVNTAFGSVSLEAFGGQTKSVQGTRGGSYNSPLAGTGVEPIGTQVFQFGAKPNGQPALGQMNVNQLAGVSLGVGVRQLEGGHVRLSALELAGTGGAGFNGVHALGADVNLRLSDRLSLMGDWGKTITHTGRTDTVNSKFNNAFNASVQYDAGSLNLSAGYRYVDPYFYAPGYWGRIGAWLNPTNIAGPTVRAAWDISPRFGINVGGDLFSAARDRGMRGGLSENDTITRALVGIRWNLSQALETTLDWEGVYWQLEGAHSNPGGLPSLLTPGAFRLHPTEHYITLGTGYSLTNTAKLRLLYQFGMYDGHGFLLNAPGVGAKNTFNIVTGQVAVKF